MKQLYIIQYQSAHWCGGVSHCVAWAENEDHATDLAEWHMEDEMRDLFANEYDDEPDKDDEPAYSVDSVGLLSGSEYEEWYSDPGQRIAFYPCVNPQDEPK